MGLQIGEGNCSRVDTPNKSNALQMVAGGWYFCPTEDSNDQASCPYCKLSLDGWEPKDDPLLVYLAHFH